MTLRLILMRHAKSSWGNPTLGDHDRPLNDRGRRSASAIGAWLRGRYEPDQVLSSDSARTRETWSLVAQELKAPTQDVTWLEQLYHAPAQAMLDVLKTATEQTVMMLGHNPGIAGFANMLVARPAQHARFRDYPTAATTVIEFDVAQWRDVDWQIGQAIDFAVPRDLGVN